MEGILTSSLLFFFNLSAILSLRKELFKWLTLHMCKKLSIGTLIFSFTSLTTIYLLVSRRGNPLHLCGERFKKIQKLWQQHSITEEIGHAQEANQTLVGIDWQHL